jgi:hypothetical protein
MLIDSGVRVKLGYDSDSIRTHLSKGQTLAHSGGAVGQPGYLEHDIHLSQPSLKTAPISRFTLPSGPN